MNRQFSRQGRTASPAASRSAPLIAAAPPETREAVEEHLFSTQNGDGGWGAGAGLPSNTESTALALLALSYRAGPEVEAGTRRALRWFVQRQATDGSWPYSDAVPLGSWTTSLGVIALSRFPDHRGVAEAGADWLLDQEGRSYPWLTKLMFRIFPEREVVELDPDLTGWPWSSDTFSWIEPTAYALLALKALRPGLSGRRLEGRIREAESMIFDRTCVGGGWNYGNSVVLGEELWPYPDTTALALIALQDVEPREEIGRSLAALERMIESNDSVLVTSLAILAFQLYGREVSSLRQRLLAGLEATGPPPDTRSSALASLALAADASPLGVGAGA